MTQTGRVLPVEAGEPSWNMAVDDALVHQATAPTLRLYTWNPPGVSLGRFQHGLEDGEGAYAGLPLVRRMTGGGAIVHWHELTYSLTLSATDPRICDCSTSESYARIHGPIRAALADLGVSVAPGARSPGSQRGSFLCFHRATDLDLIAGDRKLVGSAQRRTQGRVLQHGSIILAANPLQPGTASLADLLSRPVAPPELATLLIRRFEEWLGPLEPGLLSPAEQAHASKVVNRYRFTAR